MDIPKTQTAVQLVGPDELQLNSSKEVVMPGPCQVLCKVEVVGLCFSDLKLLKQFDKHVRKSPVTGGIDPKNLEEISSYVPNSLPAVPGHEAFVTVVEVGNQVKSVTLGQRYLVQADYRWIKTHDANAAFGYNFEGGLQQYVLMDERIFVSPDQQSCLLPIDKKAATISDSARALVEPWACVEDAYVNEERTTLVKGGKMLVVADDQSLIDNEAFEQFIHEYGCPADITLLQQSTLSQKLDIPVQISDSIDQLPEFGFDDIVYYGSSADTVERLFSKIANTGMLNIVLCGNSFGRDVETAIGRTHYGGIRIIGTTTSNPADSMKTIPESDEIREGDQIDVVGAGGPMGVMHVIRNLCQKVAGITVFAGDVDDDRLAALTKMAKPLAKENNVGFMPYNAKTNAPDIEFDYIAIMAPVTQLVAAAVKKGADKALINIFAGIPATVNGPIDLDRYIQKRMYFIGTSGSTLDDMRIVLKKVETGQLDTNLSVGAVCGLKAAVEGIRAVENRSIAGKILCYPSCIDLSLIPLEKLEDHYPSVSSKLQNGIWTKEAEDELLKVASK